MTKPQLLAAIQIEDKLITVSNAREYFGGCIPGWKLFANIHNLNWKQVLRHGMLASELIQIEDIMILGLLNHVYEKQNG